MSDLSEDVNVQTETFQEFDLIEYEEEVYR
jgi:hypothetical protein